jgi:hypothetical protein
MPRKPATDAAQKDLKSPHDTGGSIGEAESGNFGKINKICYDSCYKSPSNIQTPMTKCVPVDEGIYCWLHGYLATRNHASMNCNFPKEGHQKLATLINNIGSNQHGKPAA